MESRDHNKSDDVSSRTAQSTSPCQTVEADMLYNLEIIKIMRPKTNQLENIQANILSEIELYKKEEKYEEDCRRELNILQKERQHHIDAINTIDKDISQLQRFITNSTKERESVKTRALQVYECYKPLKEEIDVSRVAIGLECLPEFIEIRHLVK